jgi:hypothetical protein
LDLLGQLRRLFEARVEDVDFGAGLFVGGMAAAAGESDSH